MFEHLTDGARKVIALAQEEALRLEHPAVGEGHILLGLIAGGEGVAAQALESLGILHSTPSKIEEIVASRAVTSGQAQHRLQESEALLFSPGAKHVFERAGFEAFQRGHNYLDTEHLLFALLAEGDGVAAEVLAGLGIDTAEATERVMELLRVESNVAP
ncbi:MAG TPA: Clp protease N-terminal domain-containing protein [Acidimicrobiales bacterium]|nr:Clp protease N-terminal domain-containing protein [Acidimicrobiales bacterium]